MGGVHSIKRSGGCRLRLEQHRGGSSALDCVEEVDESSRIGLFVRASVPVSDTGITSVTSGEEGVKTEVFISVEVNFSSLGSPIHDGPGVE